MSRYVLRYAGSARIVPGDRIDTAEVVLRAGGRVVDEAPDMLLVEGSANVARTLAHLLPEWQLSIETSTPVPSVPRPSVRSAARGNKRR